MLAKTEQLTDPQTKQAIIIICKGVPAPPF